MPAKPVSVNEDDPAKHPAILQPAPVVALGEVQLRLLAGQPSDVAHIESSRSAWIRSSASHQWS